MASNFSQLLNEIPFSCWKKLSHRSLSYFNAMKIVLFLFTGTLNILWKSKKFSSMDKETSFYNFGPKLLMTFCHKQAKMMST